MALIAFVSISIEPVIADAVPPIVGGVKIAGAAHSVDLIESSFADAGLPVPAFVLIAGFANIANKILSGNQAVAS